MKFRYIIIMMYWSLSCFSQFDLDLDMRIAQAYEYNVFNQGPSERIIVDGDSISSIRNEYYKHFDIKGGWKYNLKRHRFAASGRIQYDYFADLSEANLFRPSIKLEYTWKTGRIDYLKFGASASKYQTNRRDEESEELRAPRTYYSRWAFMKYHLTLTRRNKLYLQTQLRRKQFQPSDTQSLEYDEIKASTRYRYRTFHSKRNTHLLELEASFSDRYYTENELKRLPEIPDITNRHWHYYSLTWAYIWLSNDKYSLRMGVSGLQRKDLSQDRYTYMQYQPFVKFKIKSKKIHLTFKTSFTNRIYDNLRASRNTEDALQHVYLRGSLMFDFKVTKKLKLSIQGSYTQRKRNHSQNATSFLPYTNSKMMVGFKYHLF